MLFMNSILKLIGREKELFTTDIQNKQQELNDIVSNSRFLVLGGAGSIGQAVSKEIFKRNPKKLSLSNLETKAITLLSEIKEYSIKYQLLSLEDILK